MRLLPGSSTGFSGRPATRHLFAVALTLAAINTLSKAEGPDTTPRGDTPRIASRDTAAVTAPKADHSEALAHPVARAKRAIADCQEKYASVRDYTCTFVKRERINGHLTPQHVMQMKARTAPHSIYFKFQTPNKGREAIFVAGKHNNKVLAHDVGIGRLLAGTLTLDPRGSMAMEHTRHPVTEAGIGSLIDSVAKHWSVELTPEESKVTFEPGLTIGPHRCSMIESVHPEKKPQFLFHMVKLYIDHDHGLPIRIEAYDWPKTPGAKPELVEEYTYMNLKTNVGLAEHDFDPTNKAYSFGRF